MGFRPEPTIYTLKFQGTWLDGLVVKVGCCTVEEFNEMLRWQATTGSEVADNNDKITNRFLDYLKEWNLEDPKTGEPTPRTLEGCSRHEQPVMREILQQWQKAMAGVEDELGKDSMNGRISQEQSLGLGGA